MTVPLSLKVSYFEKFSTLCYKSLISSLTHLLHPILFH